MGYAGGSTLAPTYHDLADHTEAFQLDFDPQLITYEALLAMFWKSHRPDRPNFSRQYMTAVFPETDAQAAHARDSLERVARELGREVTTRIVTGARFVLAEDYHQKYHLRHTASLMAEFAAYSAAELVDSTVAARLNGYAAGRGTADMLETEVARFGLGDAARTALATLVRRKTRA